MHFSWFWKWFVLQMLAAVILLSVALSLMANYSGRAFVQYITNREQASVIAVAEKIARDYEHTDDLRTAARVNLRSAWHHRGPLGTQIFSGPLAEAPPPSDSLDWSPKPPMHLLDSRGNVLLGEGPGGIRANTQHKVAIVHGGKTIGYLAWQQFPGLRTEGDFTRRQMRSYLQIFAFALLLAAAFSVISSLLFLRPLKALYRATTALAQRDFSARVPEGLSDELGMLAREFNRLASELEAFDTRQKQWLADISHELRTPITALRAQIEAVQDGVQPVDDALLQTLAAEVCRLAALVEDLQILSRGDSGDLVTHRERLDLKALIGELAEHYSLRLREAGLRLKLALPSTPVVAMADKHLSYRLLSNLLENCLRYSDRPGPVVIQLKPSPRPQITVSDAGPGVPEAAIERIFDRLYRVESARSREHGGSGLGLAICRTIAHAQGGNIAAMLNRCGGLDITVDFAGEQSSCCLR